MPIYALTIFASAFLLFLVQPIMAKQILPWFGGSAAVWTTCLMFFQVVLLFGYAYADWTIRFLKPRPQVILHVVLIVLSLASLPIIAGAGWKPEGDEDPSWLILGLLAATIGLPYFLLSSTGPLLQAWFARSYPAATNVYRLFALSNAASLAALVAYPFVVEPYVTTHGQSLSWSTGYALFALLCAGSAFFSLRLAVRNGSAQATTRSPAAAESPAPRLTDYLLWLTLAAFGSFMLIAVTNHITHDVASVPFLWILPLTLYLLSFVLCFEGRNWYQRKIFFLPLLILVAAMAWALHFDGGVMNIKQAIPLFAAGLFVICMFFHGELAALKPAPRYLTGYYLMISLGGAVGGLLVGFVAPKLFNTYYEFGVGLLVTALIAAYLARRAPLVVPALALVAACVTGYHVQSYVDMLSQNARVMSRNFYGTLRVKDHENDGTRRLMHGVIMHGEQFLAPERSMEPTTYYGPTSGVGRIIEIKRESAPQIRVGVVGLGAGTLATYGRPGDVYRFYEINPEVIELAKTEFSFLGSSTANIETLLGDARLTMEREPAQRYDVLAIDAFSSDSIPTHLMTQQAMGIYLKNTKADGVIAFHVTNRFLHLAPVVKRIADEHGLHAVLISDDPDKDSDLANTDWVLVSRSRAALADPQLAAATDPIKTIPGLRLWTDSFSNLFKILK